MVRLPAFLLVLFVTACGTSDDRAPGADASTLPDAGPASGGGPDGSTGQTCDPSSCAGCCADGVCVEGTTSDACGTGGETCATCQAGQTCGAGTCDLDPDARFDLVLLDGDIDSTKVNGASWDVSSGQPDVKVHGWTIYSDEIASTTQDDNTSPDWMGETVVGQANMTYGFIIWVFDDDGLDDDFICQLTDCPVNPPGTTLECSAERGTESPSEYHGPNAGCSIRYQLTPH